VLIPKFGLRIFLDPIVLYSAYAVTLVALDTIFVLAYLLAYSIGRSSSIAGQVVLDRTWVLALLLSIFA